MPSGIYAITSPSGRQYVGSAVDIDRRWSRHRKDLRAGAHKNPGLQRAANKYGLEKLAFSTIIVCRPSDLLLFEQRAIDGFDPAYNVARIAGSSLGIRRTQEFKDKVSKGGLGRTFSAETRAKIGTKHKGKKLAPHQLQALAEGRARSPQTKEQRQELAKYMQTPESALKRAAALKGRPVSEATRRKISVSLRKTYAGRS